MKNRNRLTNEEAIKRVQEICEKKDYEFISFCDKNGNECQYCNNQTHLKLYCKKCKKVWFSATYNRFTQGTNCPNCNKIIEEVAIKNIKNICKNLNYTFLYFCDKNNQKIAWNGVFTHLALKCNNCGNIWFTCSYDNFIRGRKCPKCKHFFKKEKLENFLKKCKENNWKIIDYLNEYNKKTDWEHCEKIRLQCEVCGHIWDKSISSINSKSKCPSCAIKINGKNHVSEESKCLPLILDMCKKRNYIFKGYCNKEGKDCEWYGSSTYLILECLNCGQTWKTCTFYNFTHHLRGCPKCKQSHLENEIKEFLLDNNINFEEQKRFDWLGYQSLDFYLPDKNIAIECQGRQHFQTGWWSNDNNKLKNDYEKICYLDQNKKTLCAQHKINLLYFSNLKIDYPYEVIEDKKILLKKITE